METYEFYELAPNIFKTRNDWGLMASKCKKNNNTQKPIVFFTTFVWHIANIIEKERGTNPFNETKCRIRKYVEARQLLMMILSIHTKASLFTIGKTVGGKDHSTVLYAKKNIKNLCETDKNFNDMFCRINTQTRKYKNEIILK